MSENKYVSDVRIIPHQIEVIFNYLSNFENLAKYMSEDLLSVLTEKIPQLSIRDFQSDKDSCRFEIGGIGHAELKIVERTPFTTIKIEGQGSLPLELKFWIQLLPVEAQETKMRLTLHAEMGMMIKMMVGNKLEKGVDQLAGVLAMLPYN
jgi:carbon monoxide dehydrogenase subunit G